MRLYEAATVMRSKNAGPFRVTVDIQFGDEDAFKSAVGALESRRGEIASLYGVAMEEVEIIPFPRILTIKVAMPRTFGGAGGPLDRDVYGAQQHFPLGDMEIG